MKKRWLARVIFGVRAKRKVEEIARVNVIGCSSDHAMALGAKALGLTPHPLLVAKVEPLVRMTSSPSMLRRKKAELMQARIQAARRTRRRRQGAARTTGVDATTLTCR